MHFEQTAHSETVLTYQVSSVQLVTDKKLEAFISQKILTVETWLLAFSEDIDKVLPIKMNFLQFKLYRRRDKQFNTHVFLACFTLLLKPFRKALFCYSFK